MDARAFDHVSRTLVTAGTRRAALAALLAAAGTVLGRASRQQAAAQGCLATDADCQSDGACCSGRCKRKRNGTKVCRQAKQQGVCTIEANTCGFRSLHCGTDSGGGGCTCFVTAKGRSFCGLDFAAGTCGCTSNRQCERQLGKGTKCVPGCPTCPGSNVCVTPCPILD